MASTHERQKSGENGLLGSYSFYSEIGGRSYQEDRLVAETLKLPDRSLLVMAVMDGHLGAGVAQLAADRLVPTIGKVYRPGQDISDLLKTAVSKLHEATKNSSSGSTLSIAAIPEDEPKAYMAVLGDSPIIVFSGEDEFDVSPEHNVRSNLQEREKALKRGAYYDRRGYIGVDGADTMTQMTRALGDRGLDAALERTPEIYTEELDENSSILVATDGVIDPSHKDSSGAIHYLANLIVVDKVDAETALKSVLKRGSGDNATAIVWRAKEG